MSEPNYREEMKLPEGYKCADCRAIKFCAGIGCTTPEATKCDYWPNRFVPLRKPEAAHQGGETP
jgi:hypothetical protein